MAIRYTAIQNTAASRSITAVFLLCFSHQIPTAGMQKRTAAANVGAKIVSS